MNIQTILLLQMAHLVALKNLCRVCGRSIVTKAVKVKYPCSEHNEKLYNTFGIDTTLDSPDMHPQHFCHSCKNILYRASKAGYVHRTEVFQGWNDHTTEDVCQHYDDVRKGGRPKRVSRGRPEGGALSYLL